MLSIGHSFCKDTYDSFASPSRVFITKGISDVPAQSSARRLDAEGVRSDEELDYYSDEKIEYSKTSM